MLIIRSLATYNYDMVPCHSCIVVKSLSKPALWSLYTCISTLYLLFIYAGSWQVILGEHSSVCFVENMPPKSDIWRHFVICSTEECKAICKYCDAKVSRGGKTSASFTTSNLRKHLTVKHRDLALAELYRKVSTTSSDSDADASSSTQPTLTEVYEKKRLWDINDCRATRIHQGIGKMIALDFQPISIVEDQGFRELLQGLAPRIC